MINDPISIQSTTTTDVACTLCGCVCDDLEFRVVGNRIESVDRACEKAAQWFLDLEHRPAAEITIDGTPGPLDQAIERAVQILRESRYPLVYGLSSSSTEGQRAAIELADRLGGVVDTSASTCHAPSVLAFQQVGESTSSLGEVKNRADLVVFWGSDPVKSHPRHLERYSNSDQAEFLNASGKDRFLVVVDVRESATAEMADLFLKVEPESDFDILWALRALIQDKPIDRESIGGIDVSELKMFAHRMMSCDYNAFFFGLGLARGPLGHMNVSALLQLSTDLHTRTRSVVRRMRKYGDVAGADSVLCWQTGYPFSVDLSRGFPRYQPGEFSADKLLSRNDPDCCLFVGTEGLSKLSDQAFEWLAQIPTIVISHDHETLPFVPTVQIPVAKYGVHRAGTAYRMDEIPIPLRPILQSQLPTDGEILATILCQREQLSVAHSQT